MLLMLYCVLLGTATGVHEGFHLRLQLLERLIPPGVALVLGRAVDGLLAMFGVLMAVNGLALAAVTSAHLIPTLDVSRAVAYWPFMVSGALITLFALDNLYRSFRTGPHS